MSVDRKQPKRVRCDLCGDVARYKNGKLRLCNGHFDTLDKDAAGAVGWLPVDDIKCGRCGDSGKVRPVILRQFALVPCPQCKGEATHEKRWSDIVQIPEVTDDMPIAEVGECDNLRNIRDILNVLQDDGHYFGTAKALISRVMFTLYRVEMGADTVEGCSVTQYVRGKSDMLVDCVCPQCGEDFQTQKAPMGPTYCCNGCRTNADRDADREES